MSKWEHFVVPIFLLEIKILALKQTLVMHLMAVHPDEHSVLHLHVSLLHFCFIRFQWYAFLYILQIWAFIDQEIRIILAEFWSFYQQAHIFESLVYVVVFVEKDWCICFLGST